jgi:hypothetical protein
MKILAILVGSLALGLMAMACGSSDESQGIAIVVGNPRTVVPGIGTAANNAPQATQPRTNPPANPQQTGTEVLDIAFSGAMQGAWRTGDRSTGVTCIVFGNNQLNIAMFGVINNANYGLTVHQDGFAPNAFTFPMAASATAPWVQITSPTDAKLQWDLNGPKGKGSLTIAGNATSQVGGSIDADLADKNGGAAVHVRGSFTCRVGGR